MKIITIIVRVLLGLLFVFSAVVVLFKLVPQPEMTGNVGLFMKGMEATGYLLILIKLTELVCGLAFLVGRFVPLATVVIFPVTLNILLFHIFLVPDGLIMAILIMAANLFLAYAYRKNYVTVFAVK